MGFPGHMEADGRGSRNLSGESGFSVEDVRTEALRQGAWAGWCLEGQQAEALSRGSKPPSPPARESQPHWHSPLARGGGTDMPLPEKSYRYTRCFPGRP